MPEKKRKSKKDPRLDRAGVAGNKPKRTPSHAKKSHIVVAKEGDKIKTIRFGQQGRYYGWQTTAAAPASNNERLSSASCCLGQGH